MRHFNYTLKPSSISSAKPRARLYKLTDGGGLFVAVAPTGAKSWRYQYAFDGRRHEVTIGPFPELGVSAARERHAALRALVAKGENPARLKQEDKAARRALARTGPDQFAAFSRQWLTDKMLNKSDTYRKQTEYLLAEHIWPAIGQYRLSDVKPAHVLALIEKLRESPHTAERMRWIIQRTYDYAIQKLMVEQNPARPLRGVITLPPSAHHRHLSEAELGAFWRALCADQGAHPSTVAASKLVLYSMCRKNEVTRAKWSEFDLDAARWTIPAERMKMRQAHRVYLSTQAVEILRVQKSISGHGDYVFPSIFYSRKPLSESTINLLFNRLDFGVSAFSPHGMRGTTATLLREHGFGRDVVELLLAHAEKNRVTAAYQHHEMESERRRALQFLADYVDSLVGDAATPSACLSSQQKVNL